MDLSVLSTNLRRLRAASGKSQGELAEIAQMSRVGYRNVETGEVAPRMDTLMRIAAALDVRLDELLTPVRPLTRVRFRALKKMTTREDLLARVGRTLGDYNDLETLLSEKRPFAFGHLQKQFKARRSNSSRAADAAGAAREAVRLGDGELIRDICGLLEDHGLKVLTPKLASEGFFGLSIASEDGGPAVVVNTWDRISVERWIFTAAHELGHLLLHLHAYDTTQTEESKDEENEADVFAGHFLMPDGVFERELREARGLALVDCVLKLKRIFRVSYRTVLYRVSTKLPPRERAKLWMRFQVEYKRRTGRSLKGSDEPDGLSPAAFYGRPPDRGADEPERLLSCDFVQDRLSRLVRQAVENDKITLARGAQILDLRVEEMREIAASWWSDG